MVVVEGKNGLMNPMIQSINKLHYSENLVKSS